MASTGRGVKDLRSWEEAFSYPVSTTLQIERELRNGIAANKERLRTLVGASYRDLLDTAERIVHLDERMRETEELLAKVSLQCNAESIDREARRLAELQEQAAQQKSGGRQLAAQLSLLRRCQTRLSRTFRQGGSILSAAKVLAVSRLLNKSIGQRDDAPPILESTSARLSSQRRRLLSRIDIILSRPSSTLEQLIDAICALCIATSSSSSDAVRHFHDLRLEEIRRLSTATEQDPGDVLVGFEYYLESLRTTQQLLGRQFSDTLRDLRSQPILGSPDIQSMEDLELDSVRPFIPAEILSFVPWIKHHDAAEAEALPVLEKWSSTAFAEICLSLKRAIHSFLDTPQLLAFREKIFQLWLSASFSTPTHSASDVFEALRVHINGRMTDLLRAEAESLPTVASEIASALERDDDDDDSTLLLPSSTWHHDYVKAPVGKGGLHFKKQLVDRHLGQSKTTNFMLSSLSKWTASMSARLEQIQRLRKTRWVDVIEEAEGAGDGEEQRGDRIEKALQKEDPSLYERECMFSLDTATLEFERKMKELVKNLDEAEATKAVLFLLRAIRGIYQRLTASFPHQDLTLLASTVPHLHRLLATSTATRLLDSVKSSPSSFLLTKRRAKALSHLWEGSPPLPTQPSPRVFQLLQRLTASMAEQGPDIWSRDAVAAVKKAVRSGMVERKLLLRADSGGVVVNGARQQALNGHADDSRGNEGREAREQDPAAIAADIQNLFDLLYLSNALGVPGEHSDGEGEGEGESDARLESTTFEQAIRHGKRSVLGHIDGAASSMLEGKAREYWARTSTLFGLLVV